MGDARDLTQFELQGDVRDRLREMLVARGFVVKG
jgi:translation initiation factor 1 (eIF-1/SUI1)